MNFEHQLLFDAVNVGAVAFGIHNVDCSVVVRIDKVGNVGAGALDDLSVSRFKLARNQLVGDLLAKGCTVNCAKVDGRAAFFFRLVAAAGLVAEFIGRAGAAARMLLAELRRGEVCRSQPRISAYRADNTNLKSLGLLITSRAVNGCAPVSTTAPLQTRAYSAHSAGKGITVSHLF